MVLYQSCADIDYYVDVFAMFVNHRCEREYFVFFLNAEFPIEVLRKVFYFVETWYFESRF